MAPAAVGVARRRCRAALSASKGLYCYRTVDSLNAVDKGCPMKSAWGVALQLVGAVAGLGALMTFVGGAIVWIQFTELKLPADQAVTLLPKQLLLIVGAHEMAVSVGVALLVAVVLIVLNVSGARVPRKRITLIGLAALA